MLNIFTIPLPVYPDFEATGKSKPRKAWETQEDPDPSGKQQEICNQFTQKSQNYTTDCPFNYIRLLI